MAISTECSLHKLPENIATEEVVDAVQLVTKLETYDIPFIHGHKVCDYLREKVLALSPYKDKISYLGKGLQRSGRDFVELKRELRAITQGYFDKLDEDDRLAISKRFGETVTADWIWMVAAAKYFQDYEIVAQTRGIKYSAEVGSDVGDDKIRVWDMRRKLGYY